MALLATLAWLVAPPAATSAPGQGESGATINVSFGDSCRDFTARSSKDISHVELHYVDDRLVKLEPIDSPDYALDGGAGNEIDFAIVKSGTTREQFDCTQTNSPPTALLKIQTPECFAFFSGGLACEQSIQRTEWTSTSDIPDDGGTESGFFHWVCGALSDRSLCAFTVSFSGTSSTDPDGDIASWSIDFGDGTSASGSWSTSPPSEVAHDYSPDSSGDVGCVGFGGFGSDVCVITLTVTDSAGQSDSDTMVMAFVDQTPD